MKTQQPLEITRDLVEIRIKNFKGKITKIIEIMLGGGDEHRVSTSEQMPNKCRAIQYKLIHKRD